MGERDKMINGEIYEPFCQELEQDRFRAKELCREYNLLHADEKDKKQEILKKLLGNAGDSSIIEPNFFCDYGYNIEFDGFVYVNHNSVFLDCAKIKIGADTFIGPNCGPLFTQRMQRIELQEKNGQDQLPLVMVFGLEEMLLFFPG